MNKYIVFLIFLSLLVPPTVFGTAQISITESSGQTDSPVIVKNNSGNTLFEILSDGKTVVDRFIKFSSSGLTAIRTYVFPDSSGTVVLENTTQTLVAKTIDVESTNILKQTTPVTGEYLRDNGAKFVSSAMIAGQNIAITNSGNDATLAALNKITSVSANTVLDSTYGTVKVDASGGTRTITLPTAVGISGKIYTIIKSDSADNSVIVATTSSQTINGLTTYVMRVQNESVTIQSDGANWVILSKYGRLPFAQISDTTNQGVAASSAAVNISMNTNDSIFGIQHSTSLASNHQITIIEPGMYFVAPAIIVHAIRKKL